MKRPWLFVALLIGCSPSDMEPPGDPPPQQLKWQKELLPTSGLHFAQSARGLRVVRGITHLHSVYSHDACDNNPQPGGQPNAPCLADLRRGLCQTRMDFALLTDHATLMADTPFPDLFLTDAAAGD